MRSSNDNLLRKEMEKEHFQRESTLQDEERSKPNLQIFNEFAKEHLKIKDKVSFHQGNPQFSTSKEQKEFKVIKKIFESFPNHIRDFYHTKKDFVKSFDEFD